MTDCSVRLVWLFASLPMFVAGLVPLLAWRFRIANVVLTVNALILAIAIWRKYVRWGLPRTSLSVGVVLLVVAQVVFWHPRWACGWLDDLLCFAQNLVTLGLGLIALALLWWGELLRRRGRFSFFDLGRRFTMTPSAVRLTIGLALLPLLPGFFFMELLALETLAGGVWSEPIRVALCFEGCAVLAIAVWLWLWRSAVEWNRRRRVVTGVLGAALLASPVALLLRGPPWFVPSDWGALIPLVMYALWLAVTAWVWRSRQSLRVFMPAGGSAAIEGLARCPNCNYSLKGLHEVRCPECGWASTIDDVVERTLAAITAGP